MRNAKRVFDVALVGEKMPSFAKRWWRVHRGFEMNDRVGRIARCNGASCQQQAGANELAEHKSLAALPWLKISLEQAGKCALRFACLVIECCQFDGKIVARCDRSRMTKQLCATALRRDTSALPKLVALIQNAAILWIG